MIRRSLIGHTMVLLWILLGGCGNLELGHRARQLPAPLFQVGPDKSYQLALDGFGQASLNGAPLTLPAFAEPGRFLVRLVDVTPLPVLWRPHHARDGGVLIAGLATASPLAVAGCRPGHRLLKLDGEAIADAEQLVRRLEGLEEGEVVELRAVGVEGAPYTLTLTVPKNGTHEQRVWLPLVTDVRAAPLGWSVGVGPLDGLFHQRTELRYAADEDLYHRDRQGGCLFNLIQWRSTSYPSGWEGQDRSVLRLFWLWEIPL